jgi:hypothetical protein
LGGGVIEVGRAMTRFLPTVSVASIAGSIDQPAPLLGQTDAVRHPITLCGSGFAWTAVLWRGGNKDDG